MGYIIKQGIANISKEPVKVSLSSNANFVEFESLGNTEAKKVEVTLKILSNGDFEKSGRSSTNLARFRLVFKDDNKYDYKGSKKEDSLNNYTFYIGSNSYRDRVKTAESLCNCFLNNEYLFTNFNIHVLLDDKASMSPLIRIVSKGEGDAYSFEIQTDDDIKDDFIHFMSISGNPSGTVSSDTIDEGTESAQIALYMHSNTGIFLGEPEHPSTSNMGTPLIQISKSYGGIPLWFDISTTPKSKESYSNEFLNSTDWVDAGTVQDLRFIAKRILHTKKRYEIDSFYYSDVLYFLTGYTQNLESNDLSDYVYDAQFKNVVKPLTKQPPLYHIKGQKQYFNFILQDADHSVDLRNNEYNLGIMYKLYSQSGKLLERVIAHEQNRRLFHIANTINLDLDGVMEGYNVGYAEVCLCRSGVEISYPLKFFVLPDCLYRVNDFAFLNSLGGWSSFNFSGKASTDFKASANTIHKAQTPYYNISDEIESVYNKEVVEQFVVHSMPVNSSLCNWLKELSSSVAVYELATKRYVIVDELNIKPNTQDDLFKLEMKYHYSDKYNGLIV